ncbi:MULTISPECIES: hypothetical protein [Morganellaceae]|uniref:hypothetical protein n=1 Tax=Morganellaceae TaxID=1903414 RepID=UPI000D6E8449|nr:MULTISPECIES: hypothetical protein [Proteus]NBL77746.1 hypothetical protein [Proteus sp. G2672]QPT33068.1 hypothetical protein I6G31_13280 [Proteus penneri]
MAKPRKGKKNDDRERAKTSREKRKEDLGAPFTINMHDKNKKRLREICVHFGHDGMMEREKGTGRIFSQIIMNVVDYYYITTVIEPKNDNVKLLIKTFKRIWKLFNLKNNNLILKHKHLLIKDKNLDGNINLIKKEKEREKVEEILKSIAKYMTENKYYIPPYLFNNKFDARDKKKWEPKDVLYLLDTQGVISKIQKM